MLHLRLSEVYEQAGNVDGARRLLDKALKKYKYSKKVWMAFQHFGTFVLLFVLCSLLFVLSFVLVPLAC